LEQRSTSLLTSDIPGHSTKDVTIRLVVFIFLHKETLTDSLTLYTENMP